MKALQTPERVAVWKRLVRENHPLYRNLQLAAQSNTYGDYGQLGAALYGWTGDTKWVGWWWKALQATGWLQKIATGLYIDQNTVREYSATWVLYYDWLKDVLPSAQNQALRDLIWNGVQVALKLPSVTNGGWRMGDTDQTLGQHFMLVLAEALVGPDDARFAKLSATYPQIGGLTPSGNPSARTSSRDAVADYVRCAAGGTWPVSTEYNCGDMSLLLMGYEMVRTVLPGKDNYPEITAWMQSIPTGIILETTPDFTNLMRWNDDERISMSEKATLQPRVTFCALAASVLGDTLEASYLRSYIDTLQHLPKSIDPSGYGAVPQPRFYFFADPHALRTNWMTVGLHYTSPGVGLARVYTGWGPSESAAHLSFPPTRLIDHEQYNPSVDGRLIRQGEAVWDHPIAYGAYRAQHLNVSGSYEEPGMASRTLLSLHAQDGFAYVWSRTGGLLSNFLHPVPTPWLNELSRAMAYQRLPDGSDCIVMLDYWDIAGDPHKLNNWSGYPHTDQDQIIGSGNPATLRFCCPVPALTSEMGNRLDFSWPSPLGRSVVSGSVFTPAGYTYHDVDQTIAFAPIKSYFLAGALKHHLLIAPKLPGHPFYTFSAIVAHNPTTPAPSILWDEGQMQASIGGIVFGFDTVNKVVRSIVLASP